MYLTTAQLCDLPNSIQFSILPILYAVVLTCTLVVTIGLSICLHQVRTRTPIVCNAGSQQPSYAVFTVGTTIAAMILFAVFVLLHLRYSREYYRAVLAYSEWDRDSPSLPPPGEDGNDDGTVAIDIYGTIPYSQRQMILSWVSFLIGATHCVGLSTMGALNYRQWPRLHNIAAVVYIFTGLLFQIIYTVQSMLQYFATIGNGGRSGGSEHHQEYDIPLGILVLRIIVMFGAVLSAMLMVIPAFLEQRRVLTRRRQQLAIRRGFLPDGSRQNTNHHRHHRQSTTQKYSGGGKTGTGSHRPSVTTATTEPHDQRDQHVLVIDSGHTDTDSNTTTSGSSHIHTTARGGGGAIRSGMTTAAGVHGNITPSSQAMTNRTTTTTSTSSRSLFSQKNSHHHQLRTPYQPQHQPPLTSAPLVATASTTTTTTNTNTIAGTTMDDNMSQTSTQTQIHIHTPRFASLGPAAASSSVAGHHHHLDHDHDGVSNPPSPVAQRQRAQTTSMMPLEVGGGSADHHHPQQHHAIQRHPSDYTHHHMYGSRGQYHDDDGDGDGDGDGEHVHRDIASTPQQQHHHVQADHHTSSVELSTLRPTTTLPPLSIVTSTATVTPADKDTTTTTTADRHALPPINITDVIPSTLTVCANQEGVSIENKDELLAIQPKVYKAPGTAWKTCCGDVDPSTTKHMQCWAVLQYTAILCATIFYGSLYVDLQHICILY